MKHFGCAVLGAGLRLLKSLKGTEGTSAQLHSLRQIYFNKKYKDVSPKT